MRPNVHRLPFISLINDSTFSLLFFYVSVGVIPVGVGTEDDFCFLKSKRISDDRLRLDSLASLTLSTERLTSMIFLTLLHGANLCGLRVKIEKTIMRPIRKCKVFFY